MKTVKPALPSDDKRWKIVDARMRRFGYQSNALIETLHAAQQAFGYLDDEALRFISRALHVPPSRVYGVSTFYNLFVFKPQGKHTCVVCLGTACFVKGSGKILGAVEERAGVRSGETTPDNQLSILTARCLGACGIAPVVVLDGNVSGHLTPELALAKVEPLLEYDAR